MTTPEEEIRGSEVAPGSEVEKLKNSLAEAEAKAQANLAGWQRAQADFINYKKRCEQEKGDIAQYANCNLMLGFLPVLDDLERAFANLSADQAENECMKGLKLIRQKLLRFLEGQGLTYIKALGEKFDPHLHEAVSQRSGPEDIVVEETQKGYKFRDRVMRPSMVVVGSGEEKAKEE